MREARRANRSDVLVRWPLGWAGEARSRRREVVFAFALAALAAFALFGRGRAWERVLVGAVVAGGLARAARVLRERRLERPRGFIQIDRAGVARVDGGGPTRLATWGEPFGVTLLTSRPQARLVLAFTTPQQTRYVPVDVNEEGAVAEARDLLARASSTGEAAEHDALDEAALRAADAVSLVRAVEERAPSALGRMYLSSARGDAITLDGEELRVGHRSFDLGAPLEWRGFTFHEAIGQVATIYQATWVRQGGSEMVLLAPLPPEVAGVNGAIARRRADAARSRDSAHARAVARDLRLMHALPESPPARDLRVAIERVFMLPLRRALDRAPRAPRAPAPPLPRFKPKPGGAASDA